MMMKEFTERTGIEPRFDEYEVIEKMYYDFNGNKDEFCKDFLKNNRMQEIYDARLEKIDSLKSRLVDIEKDLMAENAAMKRENEELKEQLDRELEWKPYEMREDVSQADYAKLAEGAENGKCSRYMTDEEAKDWICSEFDFDRSKITIIHEVDEWEINRHNQLRKTGKKIDRRPVYCSTDYHYIRFNTSHWYYEVWNDQLRPYYC